MKINCSVGIKRLFYFDFNITLRAREFAENEKKKDPSLQTNPAVRDARNESRNENTEQRAEVSGL